MEPRIMPLSLSPWPSDNATWRDALEAIRNVVLAGSHPAAETCWMCGAHAEVELCVEDDSEEWVRHAEVFLCEGHVDSFVQEWGGDVSALWTGVEWNTWENVLDDPDVLWRA